MEVELEERIKPGIIFLNILGYKLEIPKQFIQWEDMLIRDEQNNKIGIAYFTKNALEMQGNKENKSFSASYNLKSYHDDNQIVCHFNNKNYQFIITLNLNLPVIGEYTRKINMQVFQNNYKELEFNVPIISNQVLLDSFDRERGYEHIEFKEFNNSLGIFYETGNDKFFKTSKAIKCENQIITFKEEKYEYGVDISKRNYHLKEEEEDNIIKLLSYYMLKINNAYRVPFMELNNLSDGLLSQILAFALPQYDNKDIASIFGVHKQNICWQEEILNSPVRRLVK